MPNFGKIRPAIVERSKSCAVMGVHNRSYNNRPFYDRRLRKGRQSTQCYCPCADIYGELTLIPLLLPCSTLGGHCLEVVNI